ncbi:hypothetical protein [Candidatus Binatus sp.]|uniref:hypothetical protein n=1 Tax=Candidatus Binatus sp. TaxID=2811406 RepID=UPI003BB010B8
MRNIAVQVFPLRADMASMRKFINSYLNFVDDDYPLPFYFKPAIPYVMLQILHYPNLAVSTANAVRFPQKEVSFSVPLEVYIVDEYGNRIFNHYATCAPFLYLDVQPSVVSGRDIFGLPKVALRFWPIDSTFRPEEPSLITDLRLRERGADGDEFNPFVKVFQDPQRFTSTRAIDDAISAVPDGLARWISMMTGAWQQAVQPPTLGYERTRDIASMLQMGRAGIGSLINSVPAFSWFRPALIDYESTADIQLAPINIEMVSLKQFRDAEDTDLACYQSLISSTLYFDKMIAAGSLADPLSTDLSGGAFVRLYEVQTQPLIDSFGLATESMIRTDSGHVWTIRPQAPFWFTADLSYSLGINLAWRTKRRSWSSTERLGPPAKETTRYNTFGSGALEEVPQRLVSPESSVLMLALPVTDEGRKKIQSLCEHYFCNDFLSIQPILPEAGGFVFMLVYDLLNSAEGIGSAREHDVEIDVPVALSYKDDPKNIFGYGVFPIYAFSDSESATLTQSEVYGRPTVLSHIGGIIIDAIRSLRPLSKGSNYPELKPDYEQPVLSVNTSVLGALYSGDRLTNRRLIDVVQGPREPNQSIGQHVIDALDKMFPIVVPWVGLKQVIDCRLPGRASYQSIVLQGIKFLRLEVPHLIDSAFDVKIHRYQSLPIVDTLGLKVVDSHPGRYTTVDTINAAYGIWLRVDLQAQNAVNLAERAGDSEWCYADKADLKDFENQERVWNLVVVALAKLMIVLLLLMYPPPVPPPILLTYLRVTLATRIGKRYKKTSKDQKSWQKKPGS